MTDDWECVLMAAVGCLTDVGFSSDGRSLLCVGHQGRGVYDCVSGERVARDSRDAWTFTGEDGAVEGIRPLAGQSVQVAGLMSGDRLSMHGSGWTVNESSGGVELSSSGAIRRLPETEELRAFGFDGTGRTLALATSGSLRVLRLREEAP